MDFCVPSSLCRPSLPHKASSLVSPFPDRLALSHSATCASTIIRTPVDRHPDAMSLKILSSVNRERLPLDKQRTIEQVLAKLRDSEPTRKAYAQILRLYIEMGLPDESLRVYFAMKAEGFTPGVVLETSLLNLCMNSGFPDVARQIFGQMPEKNVVTWTSLIVGCIKNDQHWIGFALFCQMLAAGVCPNDFTFNAAVQACTSLDDGKQVHSLAVKTGFISDSRVENCLIDMYARYGVISDAQRIFEKMLCPDVVSYTTLIAGLSHNGFFETAINAFVRMLNMGLSPNEHTVGSVLVACGNIFACKLGMQIHAYAIKSELCGIYAASSLVHMYSKGSLIDYARTVFDVMEVKNLVTWSGMIDGYVKNGLVKAALFLFMQMLVMGIKPNEYTLATLISSCGLSSIGISEALQLHGYAIKLNYESNNHVMNALITMYARKNMVDELGHVFKRIAFRDSVSWSAAIAGYAQNEQNEEAARMLCLMHREGAEPTKHAFASVISSCGDLAALDQGRHFHALALKSSFDQHICVSNALVSMYSKCGSMVDACMAFEVTPEPDVMSWNTLIHGYAHHGMGGEALQVFERMTSLGEVPDGATIVGILSACSHAGYVNEARKYFAKIKSEYGVTPTISHYCCMVDTLGRAGKLDEAAELIKEMPFEPDGIIWKTLLAACRLHKDLRLGKIAAAQAISLSPNDSANYILLANLLEENGEPDGAERARRVMETMCAKKEAGYSWIEIRNVVHAFSSRDKSHPCTKHIYAKLEELLIEMKEAGYKPDLDIGT
ncbi:pentatricopeptide repeat-containing protein At2g13600-like [Nymphaea colorata]|uniref:Pentacotripeptide-repeat region of PRORP domain-containing protein n=1 Tax=Nymphaea colorata TaxID=210225 RepID=A0A5K1AZV7_9MAGN|nr:pentatricopeptide repeat-containing protein At2g13600-like [Nymphaea colorata]